MNAVTDGASDVVRRRSSRIPLSLHGNPQTHYYLRQRHCNSRGAVFAVTAKDASCSIVELAKELKHRYNERQVHMPSREKGTYWTWGMFPGARLGYPEQKDIENAKVVFTASLKSEMLPNEAAKYFSKDGPKVTIEDMRIHMELFLEVYKGMLEDGDMSAKAKLSTQFLRNHASRVFTALSRASNFVAMDVVIGTFEWIDEYLSVKYELRTNKDEKLDCSIPELDIEESISTRSNSSEEWCN